MYSQLSAFATSTDRHEILKLLGCLDEFIADFLTDIALDHTIHMYVIMIMMFVRTWSITQKTGLLMTRHISTNVSSRFAKRFFTLAKALQ